MNFSAYAEQKETISGIQLVSCGHIFAKHGREICRPNGREDWLLFYIVNESETFYLNKTRTGKSGSFILFAPHEKQHHEYLGNKTAEFYYIHFNCKQLPGNVSLTTSKLYDTLFNRQICNMFEEIIEETLGKQPFYEKLCIYKLLNLLTILERGTIHENYPAKENFGQIARAVQHMNKSYNSNFSLEEYATMCTMSKYHFLRIFTKIVGQTPLEYRNNIRMQHAVDLLLEEKMSIEQISALLGYSSASYFSTAFKQKYGLSPKQYQKSH